MKFKYIPYDRRLLPKARELRSNETPAEKVFWKTLIHSKNINHKFTRQKPLDNFIVDFYCSELMLAIEIDGEIHLTSRARDQERTDILSGKYDILVVRYSNEEVLNNTMGVINNLEKIIHSRRESFPPDKGD